MLRLSCFLPLLLLIAAGTAPVQEKSLGKTWIKGVPITTDWKKAIKRARESGKMLFIYNGWQGGGI